MLIFELTDVDYYMNRPAVLLETCYKMLVPVSHLWLFIAYHSAMNKNGFKTEPLASYQYWKECDSFWLKLLALASSERYCVFSVQCWTVSSLLSTVPHALYHFMAPSYGTGHGNIVPFRRHQKAKIMISPVITGMRSFLERRGVNPAAVVELQLGLCCLFIFHL